MDKKVYNYVYNTEKCNKHFFFIYIFFKDLPLRYKKYSEN